MEQRTKEWFDARRGKFTGSESSILLMKKGTDGLETYILEKIAEMLTSELPEPFETAATKWGKENEPIAKMWYERYSSNQVEDCGFIQHPTIEYFGASPDGIVWEEGRKGVIEIKCPFVTTNHLHHCRIKDSDYFKKYFKAYYWQTVSEMICAEAEFVDFISFDPRIDDDCGLFVKRMELNQDDVRLLIDSVIRARIDMMAIAKEIKVTIK